MAELPLQDLKVVDLSWVVAGPAIGRVLADYGAGVLHVESALHVETARVVGPFYGGKVGTENSALYENVSAGKLQCWARRFPPLGIRDTQSAR